MCKVEYFHIVFRDGTRKRQERNFHCHRGTRHSLCARIEYTDTFEERPATRAEEEERARAMEPVYRVISPRRRPGRDDGALRALGDDLKAVENEAGRGGNEGGGVTRHDSEVEDKDFRKSPPLSVTHRQQDRPSAASPLRPVSSSEESEPPTRRLQHLKTPDEGRSTGSTRKIVQVHQAETSDSTSPPQKTAATGRTHNRQESTAYEEMKEGQRQKEQRESKTDPPDPHLAQDKEDRRRWDRKVAEKERDAHSRAAKVARGEEKAEAARRHEQDGRPKRRGKHPATYHAPNTTGETDEQMRARLAQREEDAARIIEANRQQAERERLERLRQAGIPRRPRHGTAIHNPIDDDSDDSLPDPSRVRRGQDLKDLHDADYDPGDYHQRGGRFIESAIQTEEQREIERRAPPSAWNRPYRGDDGRRRRSTFDGRQTEENNGRERRSKRGRNDDNGRGGVGRAR